MERDPGSIGGSDDPVAAEEEAAAAEAAAIGGPAPDEDVDPAARPVVEGGGGVAEGFEEAEAALIDNAEHGDGTADPLADAFRPEPEADRIEEAYGEADELPSSQLDDQPDPDLGDARGARDR